MSDFPTPPQDQPLSHRMWMRMDLAGAWLPSTVAAPSGLRSVAADDAEALAELMLDAYTGTVDFSGEETLDDARGEVRAWLAGSPDLAASSVIERNTSLASACLVTVRDGVGYLAFVMTRHAYARQGMAAAVMQQSLRVLQDRGLQVVRLGVTRANDGAIRIYERLGFVDDGPVE